MATGQRTGKRYSRKTVRAAHRRVLKLVRGYVAANFKHRALYSDGRGLLTREELLQHMDSALSLREIR